MRKIIRASIACAASLIASVPPAFGEPVCKPVTGHFESVVVPPGQGQCPLLPGILCTTGRIWGGIQGNYQFVVTNVVPSVIVSGLPEIIFFTGKSTILSKDGDQLFDTDTGSIDTVRGGFASLVTFSGGTGSMYGATGQIRLRGKLDGATGTTWGDYTGDLCTPRK